MATKPGRVVTYHEGLPPIIYMPTLSHGLARLHDRLKPLYHYISNNIVRMATKPRLGGFQP